MSDTVIILQEEAVLAAEGKAGRTPKIQDVERIPIEGYGDLYEQWKTALANYKEEHDPSSVKLVLPAIYSSARMTQIPYASGRQLTKMAENVLQENASEDVADYGVIQSDRREGVSLCCGSADESVLKRVLEICKEISLKVKEITVPMEGYLRLFSQLKEYRRNTAIYLLFEESSVISLLYREGTYIYSTRSRIFSERGTLDFGTEIVRNISGILQFYSTTKSEIPITEVYYAGCQDDDFAVSVDGIMAMNLSVHPMRLNVPFEAEGEPEEWLSCIGALISDGKKNINLCHMLKKEEETVQGTLEKGEILKHLIPPAGALVLCLALFAGVKVWNTLEKHEVQTIEEWINDPTVQEQYRAANEKTTESERLAAEKNQLDQMKTNLDTYPDLTEEKISKIVDASGSDLEVHIKSYDALTGTLTFNALSAKVIDIPGYVHKLENTELFSSVNYSGYSYDDSQYSLMLSCVMKATETGGDAE